MRLVTFTHDDKTRVGALDGKAVIDLCANDPDIPRNMVALLRGGDAMLERVRRTLDASGDAIPLDDVHLQSPVQHPRKILAIGLNYLDHVNELPEEMRAQFKAPKTPIIFNKQATAANGPYDPIHLPPESSDLDYEAELAVVIGKTCRRVRPEDVKKVIAGYTVANDVTVRDWQRASPTMTMGKSWDTHCPMGPALVTADEVPDPQNLAVKLTVDGEERQSFNTRDMHFDIAAQITYISTAFTLEPGDVLLTGTSAGSGVFRPEGGMLKEGQTVRTEIEGLGFMENTVVADPGTSFIR